MKGFECCHCTFSFVSRIHSDSKCKAKWDKVTAPCYVLVAKSAYIHQNVAELLTFCVFVFHCYFKQVFNWSALKPPFQMTYRCGFALVQTKTWNHILTLAPISTLHVILNIIASLIGMTFTRLFCSCPATMQ